MKMRFEDEIASLRSGPLTACGIEALQVNLGYRCNMTCKHCHIGAGPQRSEEMSRDVIEEVLRVLREGSVGVLDITGGAPELHPHFRYLVGEAVSSGCHVVTRTNLTIFFETGMQDLCTFYERNSVEVIASLPYYTENEVDRIRGKGTFQKSVEAIRKLNSLGYGNGLSGRRLNLVYNPAGAFLAPPQERLEDDYRRELVGRYGVFFDRLYAFTNMPIGRFKAYLERTGGLPKYMEKLAIAFNPATLDGLMCRHLVNVGWDGTLYDCDFNQVLGLTLGGDEPQRLRDFDYAVLARRKISLGDHCYGCTAGQGST
jgi:radical SAM/Cys-rich protein